MNACKPSGCPIVRCICGNPYLLLLRPRSWPTVAGHVLAGAMMARGMDALQAPLAWPMLLGMVLWTIFLHGGTLAYNSAFDKDTGDVGFLDNPPPPPRGLAAYSLALMALGAVGAAGLIVLLQRIAGAGAAGGAFFVIYAVSLFMSWLYSAPPARLKTRGGWDVLINSIGYGGLTALAGWYAVGRVLQGTDVFIFLGFAFLFAVVYPMTQFYQMEEDRRSGARTLALMLGPNGAMLFIHVSLALTVACWCIAAAGRSMTPWGWACILLSGAVWLVFSAHWWATFKRYPHKKGFYWSMVIWAFTDAAMVAAFYYGQR